LYCGGGLSGKEGSAEGRGGLGCGVLGGGLGGGLGEGGGGGA